MIIQRRQFKDSLSGWVAYLPLLVLSALIAVGLAPGLIDHFHFSLSKLAVGHDSSQQLPPLIAWLEQPSALDEYITKYYLAWLPPLMKALYWLLNQIGIDVFSTSLLIQYGSFAGLVALGWVIGIRLGGIPCGFGIVWLIISTNFYYSSIGGIPRSFGFLLFIALFWVLMSQRFLLMNIITVVSAALYPIASVVGGIALTLWVIRDTLKFGIRGNRKNQLRLVILGIAGIISISMLLLKSEQIESQFGSAIQESEYAAFPEAGPEGRSWTRRVINSQSHAKRIATVIKSTIIAPEKYFDIPPSTPIIVIIILMSFVFLLFDSTHRTAIMLFSAAAVTAYILAEIADPYLYFSHRYAYYSLPIIFVIAVPYFLSRLSQIVLARTQKLTILTWKQTTLFTVFSAGLIAFVGGRISETHGYFYLTADEVSVLEHVSTLPRGAKIAAWPKSTVAITIPLVTRRSVLLNDKFHQSFHRDYILEMRCRADATFNAYFFPSIPNLEKLRDDFKVTHVIFDLRHFENLNSLRYFEPFNKQISNLQEQSAQSPHLIKYEGLGTRLGPYQVIPLELILPAQSAVKKSGPNCANGINP